MFRRTLPLAGLALAATLAGCSWLPGSDSSNEPSSAQAVATELAQANASLLAEAYVTLTATPIDRNAAIAMGEKLGELSQKLLTTTYPDVTVFLPHPGLPVLIEVRGDGDDVYCASNTNGAPLVTPGPCPPLPENELTRMSGALAGRAEDLKAAQEDANKKAARANAELIAREVLTAAGGSGDRIDLRVESGWAAVDTSDLADPVEVLDSDGQPVEDSPNLHERFSIRTEFPGGMACSVELKIASTFDTLAIAETTCTGEAAVPATSRPG